MTPKVIELEDLSSAIKKALRVYRHMPGIPDGLASDDLVAKASKLGISVRGRPTLQELLEHTQRSLQCEILGEFDRRTDEIK